MWRPCCTWPSSSAAPAWSAWQRWPWRRRCSRTLPPTLVRRPPRALYPPPNNIHPIIIEHALEQSAVLHPIIHPIIIEHALEQSAVLHPIIHPIIIEHLLEQSAVLHPIITEHALELYAGIFFYVHLGSSARTLASRTFSPSDRFE